jgi:hypothetical protein
VVRQGRSAEAIARANKVKREKRRTPPEVKAANEEARANARREEERFRLRTLVEIAKEGGSRADLARAVGVSEGGILRWASRAGVTSSPDWKRVSKAPRGVFLSPVETRQQQAQGRLEDIEWLVEVCKANDLEVARRVGISLGTLERFLYRHKRGDLWTAMSAYRGYAYDRNERPVR